MAAGAAIRINKAHYPVTVLGPGRRVGIWVQGCSIRCRGCVSMDTWAADPEREMPVEALIRWCRRVSGDKPDGITLSGGEPFDQPAGLGALLAGLHRWRRQVGGNFDILCYSGYPRQTLERKHPRLLELLDALIPEPFAENLPLEKIWRGSANQSLIPLSELGRERYGPFVEQDAAAQGKRMQMAVEGGRIWMIGIPDRGDMKKVEELCRARGLSLDQVSWRR